MELDAAVFEVLDDLERVERRPEQAVELPLRARLSGPRRFRRAERTL
jgi:hypothetical protein